MDFALARPDDDVAPRPAARADAPRLLEEPHAHLESKILGRERAHGTDVHGVERVVVVERFAGKRRDRVEAPAVHDAERVVARDVFGEPNAARAENTAFGIEHDARAEVHALGFVNLRLDEAALRLAVIDGVFLELA